MKLRYAFLALLLAAPTFVSAQTSAQAVFPELVITAPASIAATISNSVDFATIPQPPYTIPDTTDGLPIIGTSVFLAVVDGDSVARNVTHSRAGVTAPISLALTSDGTPALGCVSAADSSSDIGNGADLVGTIAMIQRGVCPFYVKAKNAEAAGASAFIVYNPFDRDPDTGINMAGGRPEDPTLNTPGAFLPWDLAEAIFNELAAGSAVSGILRCDAGGVNADPDDPTNDGCDPMDIAGEGAPSVDGAGLFLIGQNPTSTTAHFQVRTPAAEAVTVTAYNMLGQQIAVLFQGAVVGTQDVSLSAANLPSGSYFVRAIGETFSQTQQISIVR